MSNNQIEQEIEAAVARRTIRYRCEAAIELEKNIREATDNFLEKDGSWPVFRESTIQAIVDTFHTWTNGTLNA